jgi:hypothetical protein
MFTAIANFFTRVTPAKRAKADIAELERDLYEARTARAIARQIYENKGLRITQIEKQIHELRLDYQILDGVGMHRFETETVRSIIEKELASPAGWSHGGFVGKQQP